MLAMSAKDTSAVVYLTRSDTLGARTAIDPRGVCMRTHPDITRAIDSDQERPGR